VFSLSICFLGEPFRGFELVIAKLRNFFTVCLKNEWQLDSLKFRKFHALMLLNPTFKMR